MSWFTKKPKVEEKPQKPLPPYTISPAINKQGECGYNLYRLTMKYSTYSFYEDYEAVAFNTDRNVLVKAAEHLGFYIK